VAGVYQCLPTWAPKYAMAQNEFANGDNYLTLATDQRTWQSHTLGGSAGRTDWRAKPQVPPN
jgi:hypothetical protein